MSEPLDVSDGILIARALSTLYEAISSIADTLPDTQEKIVAYTRLSETATALSKVLDGLEKKNAGLK